MRAYHDTEWGKPLKDDAKLFEFLILETMQAGLSWRCVLHKRENFRKVLHGFNPVKVSKYGAEDVKRLLADAGIIRNRLKIHATIVNARLFLEMQKKHGSFSKYIWDLIGGKPIVNRWKSMKQIPATTSESDAISRQMKLDGFKFVGSTVIYAHMQATGMVNDHLVSCPRHKQCVR